MPTRAHAGGVSGTCPGFSDGYSGATRTACDSTAWTYCQAVKALG
ncbi:hypothetical protein [Streptomyces sp. NPDC093808]